ncbi:MAG: hypothetical protein U0790_21735 [Isosphaeraceae bacterium]
MASGPEQRLNPEERANLVAYIDGELTDGESRSIATKLTHSPTARREVESLKKTWELLEYLPRPQATPALLERTQTAVERLHSREGAWQESAGTWLSVAVRLGVALLVGASLGAIGFAATRWLWPDPTERLARDLSLAEHLDEYREVGTFEFLEELVQSGEFETPSK